MESGIGSHSATQSRAGARRLFGLLILLAAAAASVVLASMAQGAAFEAKASITAGGPQYLGDTTGTVFTFTVRNTGTTDSIGGVQITRPNAGWRVIACPAAPAGWAATVTVQYCRYGSGIGMSDDIHPGESAPFQLRATTVAGSTDRVGTWAVSVRKSPAAPVPGNFVAAAPETPNALKVHVYSFQVLDVGVAVTPLVLGGSCPTLSHASHAGSNQNITVCGRNRTTATVNPQPNFSSLGGAWALTPDAFVVGPLVPPSSSSVALALWSGATIATPPATGLNVTAKIGSGPIRTGPLTTFTGYESTNAAPDAVNDLDDATEDGGAITVDVLGNDSDPDLDTLSVSAVNTTGTVGSVTNNGTDVTYNPGSNFQSLSVGDTTTDSFGYTAEDPFNASDTATVNVTIHGANDPPTANDNSGTGFGTNEDTSFTTGSVLTNDSDPDTSDVLSVSSIDTTGTLGSVTNNLDGTFGYNPNGQFDSMKPGDNTTDSFDYTLSDGHSGTSTATVTIAITGVNDAPTGVADAINGANSALSGVTLAVSTSPADPKVSVTGNILTNDTDPDDPAANLSITPATNAPTTNGGSVDVNANGTFTYRPPPGFIGSDTFTYSVHDTAPAASTGTVTVNVVGPRVWFVNPGGAAGNGTSAAPFTSLAPLTTGGAANALDDSGDYIFVYTGVGAAATGGLVLEPSQSLIGQPQGLSLTDSLARSHGLVPAGGNPINPVITNSVGDALTLANGVVVRRVDTGTSSGHGLAGTSITTADVGPNTNVTGAAGGAVLLSGAASGDIAIGSAVNNSANNAVSISGRSGGTVTLSGLIQDTGRGIVLFSNTGGAVTLNGRLILSTGTNSAFSATGGGTVSAPHASNTAQTTTGTAVNIANTTIGSAGVTFQSVSANGATNGIVLNNTGTTGSFSVTGTTGAASGGVIQNTTSHAILLNSTTGVNLTWMQILNSQHAGVKGSLVHGFSFTNNSMSGVGAAQNDVADASLAFNDTTGGQNNNLDGQVTITDNGLLDAYGGGIDIVNYNGTVSDANISSNLIGSSGNSADSKGTGLALSLLGSSSTVANLTKAELNQNTILNFPSGNGIRVQGGNTATSAAPAGVIGTANAAAPGTGTNVVQIGNNDIAGGSGNKMGGSAILASVVGRGQGNFDISSNGSPASRVRYMKGSGVGVLVAGSAIASVKVEGNYLSPENVLGAPGIGLLTDTNTQADNSVLATPTLNALVNGNVVRDPSGHGIEQVISDNNGTANVRIENNDVAAGAGYSPIYAASGSSGSPSFNPTLCTQMVNNFGGIVIDKLSTSASTYKFGIVGLSPSPATAAQASTYITGLNPVGGVTAISGDNFTSCTLPF